MRQASASVPVRCGRNAWRSLRTPIFFSADSSSGRTMERRTGARRARCCGRRRQRGRDLRVVDQCPTESAALQWRLAGAQQGPQQPRKQGDFPRKTGRRLSTNRPITESDEGLSSFLQKQITGRKQGNDSLETGGSAAPPDLPAPPAQPPRRPTYEVDVRNKPRSRIRSTDRFPVFSLLFASGEIILSP